MAYQSFLEWFSSRSETPSFLKTKWSGRALGTISYIGDAVAASLQYAVVSGWAAHRNVPTDGLDLIGRSCMIARYPGEGDEAYALRLQDRWNTWRTAGNREQLEAELEGIGLTGAFIVGNWEWDGTQIRVPIDNQSGVFQAGETLTIDGGTYTAELVTAHAGYLRVKSVSGGTPTDGDEWVGDTSGATADQDGSLITDIRPAWSLQADIDDWSRFWVYVPFASHSFAAEGLWSDPGVWDDGGVWDYEGISPQQLNDIRGIIENYRPAHERPIRIRFFLTTGNFATTPDNYTGDSFTVEMYD